MGTDKATLRLGGLSFVERIAEALRSITSEICIVSSKHVPAHWDLPVVADLLENRGAMGGLHAALTNAGSVYVAVVSCDLPFVTGQLFERLAQMCEGKYEAIAPIQPDGRPQPLCTIYDVATCRVVADEMIRSGKLRPRELLSRVRTRWVAFDELADLNGAEMFFMNVNTPGEYESARWSVGDE